MNDGNSREALASALGWWVEAGIDVLVEDHPRDWHRTPAGVTSPLQSTPAPPAAAARTAPVGRSGDAAARAAPQALTIAELRSQIEAFAGCPLRTAGVNTVFADGAEAADLMMIGEAPGAQEDRLGLPFVGPAGKLLDRMLAAIGRDRTNTTITNVTYWRPPGNRTPTPAEVETCLPFVHRHIALVRPKVLVAVGAVATRALTGDPAGIMRLRGQWRTLEVEGAGYPLMPLLHPAFLLRQPEAKRFAWNDLLAVKAKLDAD
jgi:uracil-DNA glycosylase